MSDTSPTSDAPTSVDASAESTQGAEWAPREAKTKKRRLGLWIGVGVGVCVLAAAGAASAFLIAPGTTVAGIPIGGLPVDMAADVLESRLADAQIVISGRDGDITLSGAELGASIDAQQLAEEAFEKYPLWKLGEWNPAPIPAEIEFDEAAATTALREASPTSFIDPVDATVAFDPASQTYITTPAVDGEGIDPEHVRTELAATLASGNSSLSIPGKGTAISPAITDETANTTADELNAMLSTAGFYVGEERTVPVTADVVASWITITPDGNELTITADPARIEESLGGLSEAVSRAPVTAQTIVDRRGNLLRTEIEGVAGRELSNDATIATDYAEQIARGNGVLALNVTETPFDTSSTVRRAVVSLSEQKAYFYENEDLVNSSVISSGLKYPTEKGDFKVRAHVRIQDMISSEGAVTKDVEWVLYFNGDQAFHATYWHNAFGTPQSSGCVNMTYSEARWLYNWAPHGMDVTVRD